MFPKINIDNLVQGSIDMHVHISPDALMAFRMDALDTAKSAQQAGLRAIVLKSHSYITAPIAAMAEKLVPEVKVFGSICLDHEMGGLNFRALEAAAKLGSRVVWMPTHSSSNMLSMSNDDTPENKGLSILNSENKLVPEMGKILSIVKEYDMVLASGHISPAETFALVEEALAKGISRLVITHPLIVEISKQIFTLEDQRQLAKMGAFIEYTYVGYLPHELRQDPQKLVEAIKTVGAEHCIISTDLAEYSNPPTGEGMRMFIALLLKNGINEQEIELMAKSNPARLLGLDR
jgi:hypothetical protein